MPRCRTHKKTRNRLNNEKLHKRSYKLKDGGMPQCRIVTNIRHRISPNKTLWDVLNDDAIKKIYIASMNKC